MSVENGKSKPYRPAWRSFFYPHMVLMALIFIATCVGSFKLDMGLKDLAILWLAMAVVCLLIFLHMAVKRYSSSLEIRHDEVAFETGILKRNSTEIGFEDIRTVNVSQTLLQRVLNLGNISIASSGTSGYEILVKNMPNPNEVRDEIQERKRAMAPKEPRSDAENDLPPQAAPAN